MYIKREISDKIIASSTSRPAILLTGARQTGKSTLLRHLFPEAEYVSLDRPLDAASASENPSAFFAARKLPCIIDEIQNAPGLFKELKTVIDRNRQCYGQYILTGSQQFELMKGVSESLAGRIAIFHLESLSAQELIDAKIEVNDEYIWRGGYPELWTNKKIEARSFYNDYVSTYLERDLRQFIQVSSLRDFDRFLRACALRVGNLANLSEISADAGTSSTTGKRWLDALMAGGLVSLLEPYHANQRKRLVKTPKLYFHDMGLLCFLLNLSPAGLKDSPLFPKIWENLVFSQLLRDPDISRRDLFFVRDKQKREVDFLIDSGDQAILIEAKTNEQPDVSRLHFDAITKALPQLKKARRLVACGLTDKPKIQLAGTDLYHPLYARPDRIF